MKSERIWSFLAAPVAGVFLILLLSVFATGRESPTGLSVPITHVRTFPFDHCWDDRSVWIRVLKTGIIRINETPVPRNELKLRISQIYANRSEPNAAFMMVDPEVPYERFLDVYNELTSANRNLHVGVVTDGVMRDLKACPSGASCGLDWPDHKYIPWCLYSNFPPFPALHSPLVR